MPTPLSHLPKRAHLFVATAILLASYFASAQDAITTYHVDNNRTGWNSHETILTPANVTSSTFGLLQTVVLDNSVDSQPLFVPGVTISTGAHQGVHDVVYVATENNTIYAIDAESGTILLSPNFGAPATRPPACGNTVESVGITSTPVIDLTTRTMYVMIDTQDTTGPNYRLHALDLASLTDKVTPEIVSATHTLVGGGTFTFSAANYRQRPGLLLANGNVYAAFGSFCDSAVSATRGMVLGWATGTLAPLPNNAITDTQVTSPHDYFLSSIWMSGYALSADDSGNILFVTGNSDPSGTTYDGITDIQESVVKVSPDLSTMLDIFTPFNQPQLDKQDGDFGAGGVMVVPDQPGTVPHLAVAAGKTGSMFLMNEDNLGGFSQKSNNVLGTFGIGRCFCGPAYFVDPSDGIGRVVTSGGFNVLVFKINAGTKKTTLGQVATSPSIVVAKNHYGFFTAISSNGTANPIIWAVSRPTSQVNSPVYLYAFNPESVTGGVMQQLVDLQAGNANSNNVPVVANGEVFVASQQQLRIFGLLQTARKK